MRCADCNINQAEELGCYTAKYHFFKLQYIKQTTCFERLGEKWLKASWHKF